VARERRDGAGLGTVLGEQKIAAAVGGFAGALDSNDHFGFALAAWRTSTATGSRSWPLARPTTTTAA
jgi:hypothetical protein